MEKEIIENKNDGSSAKTPEQSLKREWLDFFKFAIVTALIVIPIRMYVAQPFLVRGPSMEPTFNNSDYLIVDQLSYRLETPKRGDIVIFKSPTEKNRFLIKRVIALPGETIELGAGKVSIRKTANEQSVKLDEPYIVNHSDFVPLTLEIGEKQYFVMGDNRPASYDSRNWGLLKEENIVGRPLVRLFPLTNIGLWPGKYGN